ncbi:hypothetical protein RD792_011478 [Penstemon davidsonii]|uniref:AP2/ERF domain-containing protein n=1 Tax=Penstemon davidsonii TaxID=160366 RepID=A0ABR0D4Q1_9LAMI|nr:hypothetical protein RD792_011478 [Penstemon davidsonii]
MVDLTTKTKKIRVSYFDPDATDSSSDEETGPILKRSKRQVHEIFVRVLEKEINNFPQKKIMNLKKFVGAHKRRSGKYAAEIKDPFTKRRVWLGTFATAEEASKAYFSKKNEIKEKLRAKQRLKEKLVQDSVLEIETSDSSNETSEVVSENKEEERFGFLNGVQVIDSYEFLLGEFSQIDDLSICIREDGIWC